MDSRPDSGTDASGRARRATYQDVLDAPDDKVAEIIDGELTLSPRPSKLHANAASELGALLIPLFKRGIGGPGGWVILDEPELHLDDDILVPDLAGWRKERAERLDEGAYFTTSPDWVCEILSPSTGARDRSDKLEIYAREHVNHVWLIDPALKTLETYGWSERGWVTLKVWTGNAKARAVPFDAVELDISVLWP